MPTPLFILFYMYLLFLFLIILILRCELIQVHKAIFIIFGKFNKNKKEDILWFPFRIDFALSNFLLKIIKLILTRMYLSCTSARCFQNQISESFRQCILLFALTITFRELEMNLLLPVSARQFYFFYLFFVACVFIIILYIVLAFLKSIVFNISAHLSFQIPEVLFSDGWRLLIFPALSTRNFWILSKSLF